MPAMTNRRWRGIQTMSAHLTQVFCTWAEMTPRPSRSNAISLNAWMRSNIALARDARNVGAAGAKLLLQPLEAAVEMVNPVHDRLPLRGETGDDQRDRSPQVGRHDRRAAQAPDAADDGGVAFELDARAEARKLLHVHEAVLEDRLLDARDAARARHQRHELRLQIGREAGKRRGGDVDRLDPCAVASDANAAIVARNCRSRRRQRF